MRIFSYLLCTVPFPLNKLALTQQFFVLFYKTNEISNGESPYLYSWRFSQSFCTLALFAVSNVHAAPGDCILLRNRPKLVASSQARGVIGSILAEDLKITAQRCQFLPPKNLAYVEECIYNAQSLCKTKRNDRYVSSVLRFFSCNFEDFLLCLFI